VKPALAAAGGFLAGVLLVLLLGGASGGDTKTVTMPVATAGGTVIVTTTVPELVGQPLDVARHRTDRAHFDLKVDEGGGVLGVLVEHNWQVTSQTPAPGARLEQGSTVHVDIDRR
jgi:hypothetical protein